MSEPDVTVIDYGLGNLLSVQRGLEYCGAKVILTSDPDMVLAAKKLVLPGVGAFANAMRALQERNLGLAIQAAVNKGTPTLGICLGMQLLLDESEEFGLTKGLGLIPGRVVRVPVQTTNGVAQKIPHIGWSRLILAKARVDWRDTLLQDNLAGDAAYFVHSFMAVAEDPYHRLADCIYGGHRISAAIARDRITGCQFHPEKSGEVGLRILRRFCVD